MKEKKLDVQISQNIENDNKSVGVIGKFKNPHELLKAYNALEAEFTRRSQKLATMEKRSKIAVDKKSQGEIQFLDKKENKTDNSFLNPKNNSETSAQVEIVVENANVIENQNECKSKESENCEFYNNEILESECKNECEFCESEKNCNDCEIYSSEIDNTENQKISGLNESEFCDSEKDCKNISLGNQSEKFEKESFEKECLESEWKKRVDKFFEINPKAQPFAKEIAKEMLCDDGLKNDENGLEIAFSRFLVKSYKSPSELTNNNDFLKQYVFSNDLIKSQIIEEYLTKLSQTKPPATIKSSGISTLTPPTRPKTFEEAGWMFVKNNK